MFHHMDWAFMLGFLVLLPFILLMTVFKESHDVNVSDACVGSVVSIIVCFAVFHYAVGLKVDDWEVRSGEVTNKTRVQDSYQESYSCGTSEKPKTCYRTVYRVTWNVITNVGDAVVAKKESYSRLVYATPDPARYKQIIIGEPAALEFPFVNYVKGSPRSLFGSQAVEIQHKDLLVPYPKIVYDIYRANRVVNLNGSTQSTKKWNELLSEKHRSWGYKNKGNVVLVFAKSTDPLLALSLKNFWLQGKQNDLVLLFGLEDDGNTINWTDVFSWTENELLKIELKTDLQDLKTVEDKQAVIDVIDKHIGKFKYRDMQKDFKYLEAEIKPNDHWLIWVVLMALGASAMAIVWKKRHIDKHLGYSRFSPKHSSGFSRVRHNIGRR